MAWAIANYSDHQENLYKFMEYKSISENGNIASQRVVFILILAILTGYTYSVSLMDSNSEAPRREIKRVCRKRQSRKHNIRGAYLERSLSPEHWLDYVQADVKSNDALITKLSARNTTEKLANAYLLLRSTKQM